MQLSISLALSLVFTCTHPTGDRIPLSSHPVDLAAPYVPQDYDFLAAAVAGRSIVQLGEAVRITAELPRARLNLLRYLHEELGYDTVAFEGSLINAWLAQEVLYRATPLDRRVEEAQQIAWFDAWQTDAMREVMAYVASTQLSGRPLYLTSFDILPSISSALRQPRVGEVEALFAALEPYGATPDAETRRAWRDCLDMFASCLGDVAVAPSKTADALASLNDLQAWLDRLSPAVARKHGPAHAAALRRIGASLRQGVILCEAASTRANVGASRYQEGRDALNADNVLWLRDAVSSAHQLVVWGHHAYLAHNSTGLNLPSMGQHLHAKASGDLYTIGVFAGRGVSWQAAEHGERMPFSLRRLKTVAHYGVERLLGGVAPGDYFVDLSQAPPEDPRFTLLHTALSSRRGADWELQTVLARDFHAAVFVHEVHAPRLMQMSVLFDGALRWFGRAILAWTPYDSLPPAPWTGHPTC